MQQSEFSLTIQPRFCETDALGHINNTVIPVWFEAAREPIFKIFNPTQDLSKWNLIVAGFNFAFNAPTYFATDVIVKTWVSRIGNSSFELTQSCWQQGKQTAQAQTTMVNYDFTTEKSVALSAEIRAQLELLTGR
ncbi:acyl-CoA thioesterase [Shewanella youngdeokensis]|uniref:Thioesterase family protein n=1 Tax=Shewanella youngdeokensis TaxID=2999068 RepID=A0ABZ0JZC9_9GAMM|nr:thioesterase family protein [Shewanella sp. DAU334]